MSPVLLGVYLPRLSLCVNNSSTPYTETFRMSDTIVAYQSFIGVDLHKNTVTLAAVTCA